MASTESGWGVDHNLESERAMGEFLGSWRLLRWLLTLMYMAIGGLAFFGFSPNYGSGFVEVAVALVIVLAIDVVPIKPLCTMLAARKAGIDVLLIGVAPFTLVREGARFRKIPAFRYPSTPGEIVPKSATVDAYFATTRPLEQALLRGHLWTAAFLVLLALVAFPLTGGLLIPGLFVLAMLRELLIGWSRVYGARQSSAFIARFPDVRTAWEAGMRTSTEVIEGTRPREIAPAQVQTMLSAPRGTLQYVSGRIAAAACLGDRGERAFAAQLVDEAFASSRLDFGPIHILAQVAAARIAATVRNDPVTARKLYIAARPRRGDRYMYKLVEAAILQQEGRPDEARKVALAGLRVIPEAVSKGDAIVGKEQLEALAGIRPEPEYPHEPPASA